MILLARSAVVLRSATQSSTTISTQPLFWCWLVFEPLSLFWCWPLFDGCDDDDDDDADDDADEDDADDDDDEDDDDDDDERVPELIQSVSI